VESNTADVNLLTFWAGRLANYSRVISDPRMRCYSQPDAITRIRKFPNYRYLFIHLNLYFSSAYALAVAVHYPIAEGKASE
jgi:hypothetical protein